MKPKDGCYGAWAGNPKGQAEAKDRCVYEVCTYIGNWPHFHQCNRKRGHGPNKEYCKQHAQKVTP
jgi:hypothetical protein